MSADESKLDMSARAVVQRVNALREQQIEGPSLGHIPAPQVISMIFR